ncbi:hypothetical protein [Kovacikia minuta]|nr:hypothetical protein [Kovacikia minuta]
MQRMTIARFVKELDANGYAHVLRRAEPKAKLIVVFDPEDLAKRD